MMNTSNSHSRGIWNNFDVSVGGIGASDHGALLTVYAVSKQLENYFYTDLSCSSELNGLDASNKLEPKVIDQ